MLKYICSRLCYSKQDRATLYTTSHLDQYLTSGRFGTILIYIYIYVLYITIFTETTTCSLMKNETLERGNHKHKNGTFKPRFG